VYRNFLVVAADGKVRESLGGTLRQKGHRVTLASSGSEALLVIRNVSIDAVLVESHLPDFKADHLQEQILQLRPNCRVVTLTSFGAVRNSPELLRFGPGDYLLRADHLVGLLEGAPEGTLDRSSAHVSDRGVKSLIEVTDVLVGLLELEEQFFGGCSHQAMRLARAVAGEMSVEEETLDEVVIATLLRDIGRTGIDREVTSHLGPFSVEQMERMKSHVDGSLRLLEHIDFPWKVLPVIRHHHERYDGKGYPDGLRGREIPIGARIVTVVDSYVAMMSDRPHRPALDPEEAQDQLMRMAGTQFDPEVVEVLLRVTEKRSAGRDRGRPLVLLIEPQEEHRNLIKMRLLNEGIDVQTVASAEIALDELLRNPPDLILGDVASESSDAFQLLRQIREDDTLRHTPFAFLADRDDRILKVRALRQGVDDFLLKSLDIEELVARVENILIRESVRRDGSLSRRRRGISGQIENLPMPDIVQMLTIGMKTACVTLSSEKRKGRIWFEEGTVKHAQTTKLEGEPAFYEMLRWLQGEFVVEHGVKTKKATISHDAMFLLMEGLRMMDEEGRAGGSSEGTAGEEAAQGVVAGSDGHSGR
jgi:response regulator RpfG family c-di-GMP phosphodiesterase